MDVERLTVVVLNGLKATDLSKHDVQSKCLQIQLPVISIKGFFKHINHLTLTGVCLLVFYKLSIRLQTLQNNTESHYSDTVLLFPLARKRRNTERTVAD